MTEFMRDIMRISKRNAPLAIVYEITSNEETNLLSISKEILIE